MTQLTEDNTKDLRVGSRNLHPEPNFNYQLNRTALWSGGDWDELTDAASRIYNAADWERELTTLGEKALAEERIENAIAYFRMAEFFMFDGNPKKLSTYRKSRRLFYNFNARVFEEGEIKRERIPYSTGFLPVWVALPKSGVPVKDTVILHGGNDSYIEEFIQILRQLTKRGYAVYLFEGPGQGEVLREQGIAFTHEWHLPIKAVLDYFDLREVTIIGISLGGVLAPRAAAFEKRISRVVGFSIFPDFLDIILSKQNYMAQAMVKTLIALRQKRLTNLVLRNRMRRDPMVDWGISHALYAYGAQTPYDMLLTAKRFQIKDIGHLIDQDFLLIGAREDHFIPVSLYKDEIDALPNVRSFTYRLFTEEEDAGTHCCAGNIKLVLDFIDSWISSLVGANCEANK